MNENEITITDLKEMYHALGYKKTKVILRALWCSTKNIDYKTRLRRLQRYLENLEYKGVWR